MGHSQCIMSIYKRFFSYFSKNGEFWYFLRLEILQEKVTESFNKKLNWHAGIPLNLAEEHFTWEN